MGGKHPQAHVSTCWLSDSMSNDLLLRRKEPQAKVLTELNPTPRIKQIQMRHYCCIVIYFNLATKDVMMSVHTSHL